MRGSSRGKAVEPDQPTRSIRLNRKRGKTMGRRRRAAKRTSKVIGFKAFHDTDGDLLAWWDGIEEGDRSDTIRDILREYLFGKPKTAPPTGLSRIGEDTAWIRLALNDLPGYVEQVIQHVAAMQVTVTANSVATAASGLTEQDAARRERRMQKTKW
jgi:hypothetical protein